MAEIETGAGRNLVVCLDGTRNEPENGCTNVVRIFDMAVKDATQIVYYDPGVGTMGARSATTRIGKAATEAFGALLGHGIKDNIEEAYKFLMQTYRRGDRIFVFGFSRGAYTALALAGILRTVGLLRPNSENLIPYAVDMYTKAGKHVRRRGPNGEPTPEEVKFWAERDDFDETFGNPDLPGRFSHQLVHFLGIWDAVKTVGRLNLRARFEEEHWPFTRNVDGVATARHAVAIDEDRRPYPEYTLHIAPDKEPERAHQRWFAGVHSDVGGFYEDHRLSDIALQWVAEEAIAAGLSVDERKFEHHVGVPPGGRLPDRHSLGKVHHHPWYWYLAGRHRRGVPAGHEVDASVYKRIELTKGTADEYPIPRRVRAIRSP